MPRVTIPQARYWLLTPVEHLPNEPELSGDIVYLKGQQERGEETGLLHWQLLVVFSKKLRLRGVKSHFCPQAHCEPSRSVAANDYVWKEDTRVPDTQFEHGALPISRARSTDWDRVYDDAIIGNIENIPRTSSLEITRLSSASGSTTLSLLSDLTLPSISTGATLGLANLDAPGMRQDQSMMSSSRTLTLSGGMATEDNRPSLLMSLLVVSILVTFLSGLIVTLRWLR